MLDFFIGPYGWLIIPGLLVGMYAQIRLSSVYARNARIGTQAGLSGAEAARAILDRAGLGNMPVREVPGHLTDHFDPVKKGLFLSSENFHGRSISAVGVAAHEAGHALQQQAAYSMFNLRMFLVPATKFASVAWIGIFFLGMILAGGAYFQRFAGIAVGIFAVITLFQLVTLPVEFDASRRAKEQLVGMGLVQGNEAAAVSQVLNAAAMTYVAALVMAVLQLLRLWMIAQGRNRN